MMVNERLDYPSRPSKLNLQSVRELWEMVRLGPMQLVMSGKLRRILVWIVIIGIALAPVSLGFSLWQKAEQNSFQAKIEQRKNLLNDLRVQWSLEVGRLNETYNFDLNRSLTPSVARGLVGLTVIPRGGGPGDLFSEVPVIPPTNFTRYGGTNFHYGPLQKTTRIDIVNATIILGAQETSNLTITFSWGNTGHSPISHFQSRISEMKKVGVHTFQY